jgi:hypothetical protein
MTIGKSNKYIGMVRIVFIMAILITFVSCKKYLDKKPSQDLQVPSSLSDLQAVLNYTGLNFSSPGDLDFVSDDYYLTNSTWQSAEQREQNLYLWDKNAQVTFNDVWSLPYSTIYQCNFVLDLLPGVAKSDQNTALVNTIRGTALFLRSFHFHQLAQLFCRPYSNSSSSDPGIPLRLSSKVTELSTRATVKQCYDQAISDLKSAIPLLSTTTQLVTQPSKPAVYGMLARVYLSMGDYPNAGIYADSCLSLNKALIDYQQLNYSASPGVSVFPFVLNNPEILFLSEGSPLSNVQANRMQLVDSLLYRSYDVNDLRQKAFFSAAAVGNGYYFKGSYGNDNSTVSGFHGIATDEIYLIRAECKARANNVAGAMDDLTTLLRKRYRTGTYTDTTSANKDEALNKILMERRKELIYRGLRWSDLRRFNLEGRNITLTRVVNGVTYTLPPNDLRWVLLIPSLEITRSGIQQNPR